MSIRVIINGANGRMGKLAVKTLTSNPDFNVVAQLGRKDNLAQEIKNTSTQVVLDLTNAEAVLHNAKIIIENGAYPVIGTSGLVTTQIQELQTLCHNKKIGGIIVPNFSIGAVLMMRYAQDCAKYFSDVEIIETHHNGKLDSPSGTALRTADMIAANLAKTNTAAITIREIIPGARGATLHNIAIHSIRLPGRVAHQEVIFGGVGETLSIKHDSIDRESFMPGVTLACKKALELKELVVGLECVL